MYDIKLSVRKLIKNNKTDLYFQSIGNAFCAKYDPIQAFIICPNTTLMATPDNPQTGANVKIDKKGNKTNEQ